MEINEIRNKIDNIDSKLIQLFIERMNITLEVAKYKDENHLPVLDKKREREIITRLTSMGGEEFENYIKILFNLIFDLSKSYQNKIITKSGHLSEEIENSIKTTPQLFPSKATVACQGTEGAYSQIACDKLFSIPDISWCRNFEGVFQAVESKLCRYGILPIENSSFGSVIQVYDLMKKYKFHIVKSIKLCITHSLLTNPGVNLEDIKEIFSHEQALGQCSEFLRSLKDEKITVCENTAIAAQMVAQSGRKDVAAISSPNCAELYSLKIIPEKIQNSENNYTRFICISKEPEIYPGANKISLMLSLPHQSGSLYTVIAKFSALGLNLTKLESRPIPGRDFEFMFYVDLDASVYSAGIISLLNEFSNISDQFAFLGSYSEI